MEAVLAQMLGFILPATLAAAFAKGMIWLFEDNIKGAIKLVVKEYKALGQAKMTLRGLNAQGLIGLFLLLVLFSYLGFSALPRPELWMDPTAVIWVETGARAFYAIMFTAGLIFCLYLTQHAKD